MIRLLRGRRMLLWCACFFLFLKSCTTPEENAIPPLQQNIPRGDTNRVSANKYQPKTDTVVISAMKFNPAEITVHTGDTIVWQNNDLVLHCVTQLPANTWTSGKIAAGSSWKMEVDKSDDYFCSLHVVMKGKITVQ